jgi:vacuolar protein sorting-associated protein 54
MLTDARFLHEKLSALRGVGSLNNMVVTIVQEKVIMPKTVLNPNGVANGVKPGSPVPSSSTSTPRPRGSIDLQAQPRSNTRQNTLGSGVSVTSNNLAARPSPFAKRTLANLFGGEATMNSANSSSISLASGISTQEGSSGLVTPQLQGGGGGLAVGSSGGVTPEIMDGRASPVTLPSPPRTPGSIPFNPASKESKATGSADDTPQENVGPADQGAESSTELRAAE